MNVCFLIPETGHRASGGYLYDDRLVDALRRRGHEVRVVTTGAKASDTESLARSLATRPADILVQDELGYECYAPLNRWLRVSGATQQRIALVHVPTALLDASLDAAETEQQYLDSVDAAVFVSETTRADTLDAFDLLVPTFVAPPGVDHVGEIPARAHAGMRLVTVGHVLPHKQLCELLGVLARAQELGLSDWRLSVIGSREIDPEYVESAQDLASGLGLDDRLDWKGMLHREALMEELAGADVFLLSSRYESWGIAGTEALAAGTPVVTWAAGGPREWIGDAGICVEPGSMEQFARAIVRLSSDASLREQLSRSARSRWTALPRWDDCAAVWEQILHEMSTRSSHRART